MRVVKTSPLAPKGSRWEEETDGEAYSGAVRGVLVREELPDSGVGKETWAGASDTPLG